MSKDVEKNILDFWDNKELYKGKGVDILKNKAREYYSEEFMNQYAKWSETVSTLNSTIKTHLESKQFPIKYWKEMSYDWFCSRINNLIEEWITTNNDIILADFPIIVEKLIADYISIIITEYSKNAYSLNTLLESVKKAVIINVK